VHIGATAACLVICARRLFTFATYGIRPLDPTTYVAIKLGAVTLLGMYVQARRASRVDLLVALRSE